MGKDGKSITISPRRPDTSPQVGIDTPGPGTYEQNKWNGNLKNTSQVRIGTAKRLGLPMSARE
jgi:hypothetical protein